jgi:hypothetical protein
MALLYNVYTNLFLLIEDDTNGWTVRVDGRWSCLEASLEGIITGVTLKRRLKGNTETGLKKLRHDFTLYLPSA